MRNYVNGIEGAMHKRVAPSVPKPYPDRFQPGSFMTGQVQWAYYGGLAVVIGIGLLVAANRRKPPSSQ